MTTLAEPKPRSKSPRFALTINDGPPITAGLPNEGQLSLQFGATDPTEDNRRQYYLELAATQSPDSLARWRTQSIAAGDTLQITILAPGEFEPATDNTLDIQERPAYEPEACGDFDFKGSTLWEDLTGRYPNRVENPQKPLFEISVSGEHPIPPFRIGDLFPTILLTKTRYDIPLGLRIRNWFHGHRANPNSVGFLCGFPLDDQNRAQDTMVYTALTPGDTITIRILGEGTGA